MFELIGVERKSVRSVNECIQPDSVVENLYKQARIMQIVGMVTAVACALSVVVLGAMLGVLFVFLFAPLGAVAAFLVYFCFEFAAYRVAAKAEVVHNTAITAKILIMNNFGKDETATTPAASSPFSETPGYPSLYQTSTPRATESRAYWVCANCKTKVHTSVKKCSKCGGDTRLF